MSRGQTEICSTPNTYQNFVVAQNLVVTSYESQDFEDC